MHTVKFLRDFRSRDTGEQFYERGQEAKFNDIAVAGLLAEGAAELVKAQADTPPDSAPVVLSPAAGDAAVVVKPKKLGRPKKAKTE